MPGCSAAQGEIDRAAQATAKAEAEKKELRAALLLQFNTILQTRDTPRGLVINLSTSSSIRRSSRYGRKRVKSWPG